MIKTTQPKTASNPHDLKVGDTLYRAPDPHRVRSIGADVSVMAIGRVWGTTTSDSRFSLQTLVVEHGGKLYRTKAEYMTERELKSEWTDLARTIGNTFDRPPAGVQIGGIDQARVLLNLRKPAPVKAANNPTKEKVAK